MTELGPCKCRMRQAMRRHVTLLPLTFAVPQQARPDPSDTASEIKRRLQLSVIQADEATSETSVALPQRRETRRPA
jgi:hypothetical protein